MEDTKIIELDRKEDAVRFGMEVYGYIHDRYYDAKRYREHCKCSSPEHTSLMFAVEQCRNIMSNWVFMASGHDYTLLEEMEEESEKVIPDFPKLAGKWRRRELE